jgi:hypothetical protein
MTFIAETNTDRLHSSVQLHAIYGLISLALGGIASHAGAQVATPPEPSTSPTAAVTQDQGVRNIVWSTVPGRTVRARGAFTTTYEGNQYDRLLNVEKTILYTRGFTFARGGYSYTAFAIRSSIFLFLGIFSETRFCRGSAICP